MSTFWQPCWAVIRVDAEGKVVQPLELRRTIPVGGVQHGKAYCLSLDTSAAPGQFAEEPPAERAGVAQLDESYDGSPLRKRARGVGGSGSSEESAQDDDVDSEGEKEDEHTQNLLDEPHTAGPDEIPEDILDTAGADEISEDIMEGLRAELAPEPLPLPLGDAEPASDDAAADPDPEDVDGYILRTRRSVSKKLEAFCIRKYQQASGVAQFKLTKPWLEALKEQAIAAKLMKQGTATPDGLREILRAYMQWLKRER